MPYKYTYLLGSFLFLIYWIFLFVKFKKQRKVMLGFSLLFGFIGFFSSYFWFTADWWAPETVFGGSCGIEDFILGFTNGGIASVGYLLFFKEGEGNKKTTSSHSRTSSHSLSKEDCDGEDCNATVLFRETVARRYDREENIAGQWSKLIIPLLITPVVTFSLMWLNISSFYANCLGIISAIIYILIQRKDLIKVSFVSGFLLLILSLPIYFLLIFISPGWIEAVWMIDKLSGIIWLGIPIEDYIWYFLSGAIIGVMYPYWNGKKYVFCYLCTSPCHPRGGGDPEN